MTDQVSKSHCRSSPSPCVSLRPAVDDSRRSFQTVATSNVYTHYFKRRLRWDGRANEWLSSTATLASLARALITVRDFRNWSPT